MSTNTEDNRISSLDDSELNAVSGGGILTEPHNTPKCEQTVEVPRNDRRHHAIQDGQCPSCRIPLVDFKKGRIGISGCSGKCTKCRTEWIASLSWE